MKKLRIYLDTSVIGGCFDPEFSPWSNGLLRDIQDGIFIAVLSPLISDEVENAPQQVREIFSKLLNEGPELAQVRQFKNIFDHFLMKVREWSEH
ncbi:MAG: hypothetical protein V1799_21920 [bacterium]